MNSIDRLVFSRKLHWSFPLEVRRLENQKTGIFIATDFEGPIVTGDPLAMIMAKRLQPFMNGNLSYGTQLYNEIFNVYTPLRMKNPRLERGRDTGFGTLPFLLAAGVTEKDLQEEAKQYSYTPGALEYIQYLKSIGGIVIAITTAPENMYEKTVAKNIGIDAIIGTPYPIDLMRRHMQEAGVYEQEMRIVVDFLAECTTLFDLSAQNPHLQPYLQEAIHERIRTFYFKDLGLELDPMARRERKVTKTMFAEMLERVGVVGSKSKAAIAHRFFQNAKNRLKVTIGDGGTDEEMLRHGDISIALNGGPIYAAKYGLATPNVGVIPLICETALQNQGVSDDQFITLVTERIQKNEQYREMGIVFHKGGHENAAEYKLIHDAMKRKLRGDEVANLFPV